MRARYREDVPLPDLHGIDRARLATSADRPALWRIVRGAVRGSLRRAIPRVAVVVTLCTLMVLTLTEPAWSLGYLVVVLGFLLPYYGAAVLYLRWLLAFTLRHPDYLVVVSDDLTAVLVLGRAGRPTRPRWKVIWHGASRLGAQRGSRLRARVVPAVLDQADRLGVTLTVAVPRTLWGIARRELPGSRTHLALPWVRLLAAGADWRRRSEPTVPVILDEAE